MEHRPYPHDATNPPQSKFPWPLIAVIVVAVLLGVIVAVIPNTNKAAVEKMNNPDLATSQLRLAEITVAPQDIAGTANVDVYGEATNMGRRSLIGATVSAVFKDKNGTTIYEEQQPIERVDAKGKNKDVDAKSLGDEPLQPGKTAGFRVRYSQVPATWNHQPPEVTVSQVIQQK